MFFPTKNDHFGVFWGYPYFWKHPIVLVELKGIVGMLDILK